MVNALVVLRAGLSCRLGHRGLSARQGCFINLLWGIASRTDYDLKADMAHSGEDLSYYDAANDKYYVPYCVEPALGAARIGPHQGGHLSLVA